MPRMENSFLNKITKPTLIVDDIICKENIMTMVAKAKKENISFRPHFKTHQCAEIGEWFREVGVTKITVSSMEMAMYFANHGWKDICIAIPVNILELSKLDLFESDVKIGILVAEETAIKNIQHSNINRTVDLYIKIDTGYHRTGIYYKDTATINRIIESITAHKKTIFKGYISHAGHSYKAKGIEEIATIHNQQLAAHQSLQKLTTIADLTYSIGDTPTCSTMNNYEGITEIRPGNFVFYDLMQWTIGSCKISQIGLSMLCPVIAINQDRKEVVIHGGAVHFAKDFIIYNGQKCFGFVYEVSNERPAEDSKLGILTSLSQEHGIIQYTDDTTEFAIGQLLKIIPIHACLTAWQMSGYYTQSGKRMEKMGGNIFE